MTLPRPRYSLLSLLIFMGLVGVGAKWWHGPHHLQLSGADLQAYFPRHLIFYEENARIEFCYYNSFNGKKIGHGPILITFDKLHVAIMEFQDDMGENRVMIAEHYELKPGSISHAFSSIDDPNKRLIRGNKFIYDYQKDRFYFQSYNGQYYQISKYGYSSIIYLSEWQPVSTEIILQLDTIRYDLPVKRIKPQDEVDL